MAALASLAAATALAAPGAAPAGPAAPAAPAGPARPGAALPVGSSAASPITAHAGGIACLIEPQQTVEVRTAVDGVIANVAVDRGDRVRKGQLLVELQSQAEQVALESARFRAEMTAQINVARSRLDYAERKAARVAEMVQGRFASPQALDEAEAERKLAASELAAAQESQGLARIELRRMQEQLALRRVNSPLAGIVTERLLNPGDLSDAGSGRRPVLRLAAIDTLKVNLVLPAAQFGQVRIGQKAVVHLEVGNARHSAVVGQVDRAIDPASGTFVARLDLPNPNHQLPVGARCRAELVSGTALGAGAGTGAGL